MTETEEMDTQQLLDRLVEWLAQAPGMERVEGISIDYTAPNPFGAALAPEKLECSSKQDITGNTVWRCVYRCTLRLVMPAPEGDGTAAAENQRCLLRLMRWVQLQQAHGLAPQLGQEPTAQSITLEGGSLHTVKDGWGCYRMELTAEFELEE